MAKLKNDMWLIHAKSQRIDKVMISYLTSHLDQFTNIKLETIYLFQNSTCKLL